MFVSSYTRDRSPTSLNPLPATLPKGRKGPSRVNDYDHGRPGRRQNRTRERANPVIMSQAECEATAYYSWDATASECVRQARCERARCLFDARRDDSCRHFGGRDLLGGSTAAPDGRLMGA